MPRIPREARDRMVATIHRTWTCPWCVQLLEAPTREDKWDHLLDWHLASLQVAQADALAAIKATVR